MYILACIYYNYTKSTLISISYPYIHYIMIYTHLIHPYQYIDLPQPGIPPAASARLCQLHIELCLLGGRQVRLGHAVRLLVPRGAWPKGAPGETWEFSNTGWWFQSLFKIWKSVGMIIPNIWKNRSHIPNHQPDMIHTLWFQTSQWKMAIYRYL